MTSTTFFIIFIPILSILLLLINLLLAPHNPYQEKDSVFECGFHSFLGQNRTQFSVSFFIFALLFLLFDLEILLVYPYSVSGYNNDIYGLVIMMIFFILLTLGFIFELGKNALTIDSKQTSTLLYEDVPKSDIFMCSCLSARDIKPISLAYIFLLGIVGTVFSIPILLELSGFDVQYIADYQCYNNIITVHAIIMIFLMVNLVYNSSNHINLSRYLGKFLDIFIYDPTLILRVLYGIYLIYLFTLALIISMNGILFLVHSIPSDLVFDGLYLDFNGEYVFMTGGENSGDNLGPSGNGGSSGGGPNNNNDALYSTTSESDKRERKVTPMSFTQMCNATEPKPYSPPQASAPTPLEPLDEESLTTLGDTLSRQKNALLELRAQQQISAKRVSLGDLGYSFKKGDHVLLHLKSTNPELFVKTPNQTNVNIIISYCKKT